MKQSLDLSDYFIVGFVAIVFIAGVTMVFKFMRGKN
jgi:hypothetical protein